MQRTEVYSAPKNLSLTEVSFSTTSAVRSNVSGAIPRGWILIYARVFILELRDMGTFSCRHARNVRSRQ
jgi:hypothetical protein